MTQSIAVGTAVRANYLPFARVLAASLARHHPGVPLHVLLVDEAAGRFDPGDEPFTVVEQRNLGIAGLRQRLFRYDDRESVIAAKGDVLEHLLDLGYDAALFIDADVQLVRPVDALLRFVQRHDVSLTAHLLGPVETRDRVEREDLVRLAGTYNGGVLGLREGPEARALLDWWRTRLATHCRHRLADGMHYDQRWLDLVPAFFDGVGIFRDRAVNVAHWNLPERLGEDIALMHFSGYRPDHPAMVTHYSPRVAMRDMGARATLFDDYREALLAAGWPRTRDWEYAYDRFDDGAPIPALARRLYGLLPPPEVERFGDPFANGPGSFRAWLRGGARVGPLWQDVLDHRPDVREAFPDPGGADRAAFAAWAARDGAREHGLDPRLAPSPVYARGQREVSS